MPFLYILECADGSYYTGSTVDLERRLWEHQQGQGANFTRKRLPVKLVFSELYDRVDDAYYREKQVQGWSRAKKKALIEGRLEELPAIVNAQKQKKQPQPSAEPVEAETDSLTG